MSVPASTPFQVYDTTLRDGAQQEGMNLSVADKLAIAPLLDELGVGFIEGGWPGAVPKDTEFFKRAAKELDFRNAELAAFGSTRKAGTRAVDDPQVRALVDSEAPVVALVAKHDLRHAERALRTTGRREHRDDRGHRRVPGARGAPRRRGRRALLRRLPVRPGVLPGRRARRASRRAPRWSPCATPTAAWSPRGSRTSCTRSAAPSAPTPSSGIHAHNDSGCAVANTLAAVEAGCTHVQGTVNGYGERTGNADLLSVVANLQLKYGLPVLKVAEGLPGGLPELTRIAHAISEITNISPFARSPYVGASAFAHKAGLHASAIKVDPDLYQHIDPANVGNDMRMLISDMAGRASIELKGRELGFDLAGRPELLGRVTDRVKDAEANGYTYEAADASFELLLLEEIDGAAPAVLPRRVVADHRRAHAAGAARRRPPRRPSSCTPAASGSSARARATARSTRSTTRCARRCVTVYPELEAFELIDFKVRILDSMHGTDAVTRVLIEMTDGQRVVEHRRRRARTCSRRRGRRSRTPPSGGCATAA